MSKERHERLVDAMLVIQGKRMVEIVEHTYPDLVETYGLRILFAEIASIVSRLKRILWTNHDYEIPDWDRLFDLLTDLGNYTDFIYDEALKQEKREQINPGPGVTT